MKNIAKKISIIGVALLLLVLTVLMLTACNNEKKETQVLTLDVNPSIEFIVDENNKVVSVSATNEDAAYLLQKFSNFSGMTAEDAALKFLELSEEYGFVVEGISNGEKISISVSGESAQKLYDSVKNKISSKASEIGLSIKDMVEIEKSKLESMVRECYQEYSEDYIKNLSEEDLLNLLKTSREETKNLITNDEKQAYYIERAQTAINAKLQAIEKYIKDNNLNTDISVVASLEALKAVYSSAVVPAFNLVEDQLETLYESASTGINAKLDEYVELKNEYLDKFEEYKNALNENLPNVQELKAEMQSLKTQATNLQSALETARQNAKDVIKNLIQNQVSTTIAQINTQIDSLCNKISVNAQNFETAVQEKIVELKNKYTNESVNIWEND